MIFFFSLAVGFVCMPFLVLLWWKDYHVLWPQGQCTASSIVRPLGSLAEAPQMVLIGNHLWVSQAQPHTPHPAVTAGDHWGVEQPGRRRSQLRSVDAGHNLGNMGPSLSWKDQGHLTELPQWTPVSKARLLGKNKKTSRVKITQNNSFFSNSSLWWKREQFWCVWHLDWGVLGNYTAQTIVL